MNLQSIPSHVPPELVHELDWATPGQDESDPYARLEPLSHGPRILFDPYDRMVNGAWLLTRSEDIRYVFQHPEIFTTDSISGQSQLLGQSWPLIPLELPPVEHGKFRSMLNGAFAPKVILSMETGLRERAASLIDRFADKGECEFVEEFGRPFPVSIFMQLMGLPDEDMDMLNGWEDDLLHSREIEGRVRGARGFYDYLTDLMRKRRAKPADDLATFVVRSEVDGKLLNDDQVIGIYFLMVLAGLDTVASSLGLNFRYLATRPDQQAMLRAKPDIIASAVEELLRRFGIVGTYRRVSQDTEIAGVQMKEGDHVHLRTYLAGLDPEDFPNPMEVDFQRSPNRHIAFAYGPHRCIGSHLARRELSIALEEWLKRVPEFRIKEGHVVPIRPGGVVSVSELPLVWT